MKVEKILPIVHLVLAALYLLFAVVGTWAKRGGDNLGVFDKDGGTGFGIIAVILGIELVILAVLRLSGRKQVAPGLGVEQLTLLVSLAATANIFGFIVGWLAVFQGGTGWGVVAAYFPVSFIVQLAAITLSMTTPAKGIKPLEPGLRRTLSGVGLLAALGVALFPFLTWLSAGTISLSGFDPRTEGVPSGPRLSYILLIVGVAVAIAALMRMRSQGLAEPGPNLLHSHLLMGAAFIATLLPLATLLSVWRTDGVSAGVGIWLGLLAGLVLLGIAIFESRTRGAVAA